MKSLFAKTMMADGLTSANAATMTEKTLQTHGVHGMTRVVNSILVMTCMAKNSRHKKVGVRKRRAPFALKMGNSIGTAMFAPAQVAKNTMLSTVTIKHAKT